MNQPIQLDLYEARRRRDKGIARVSVRNEEFLLRTRNVAIYYIEIRGQVTADDLKQWFNEWHEFLKIPSPTSPKAWGAVFNDKRFKCIGITPSKQVSRKGGLIRVWGLA